jgi:acyl-homoserine lactone acylase PvdQ
MTARWLPGPLLACCLTTIGLAPEAGAEVPLANIPAEWTKSAELRRLAARAARVEIIRDDFGVPHVYADTDADAVFGMLYAQAEDDFPRVERNYIWAIGRLAEVDGESALFSDLRARLYMREAEARAAYAGAPDWLKALCDAFADGLNFYLATHPAVSPALLQRFEPWMPMYFFEGSIGGDIEQIPVAGIEAFYGDAEAPPPERQPTGRAGDDVEPAGSNGFAIAGSRSASGNALLLINPHTSFYFRGEMHVVSGEGLDAYGAVTWGQFFIYQGFNRHNGWMHTSTRVDFIDEFVEQVFERDGALYYRYGEEARPLQVDRVTLRYRDGDTLRERVFPIYRTHHGPITHASDGRWVATRINWEPARALQQSFLRTKTRDYAGFREVMDLRTNSSNNTVYADADGTIAYFHGNFVPRRDPAFDYSQPVNGADPATDWQGLHSVDEIVTLRNPPNGWLQNANSTPFTAAGDNSPKPGDFPRYMAPDPENFRGLQAVRVLEGSGKLSLEGLIEAAYDPRLMAFELLVPSLLQAWAGSGAAYPQLAPAIELLRGWDYRVSLDSRAMTIAHFYADRYLQQAAIPEGLSRMQRVHYLARDTDPGERLEVLQQTVASLQADFGRWDPAWGEVNRLQRLDGAIDSRFDDHLPSIPVPMASGRWGALAAFGARRSGDNKRLYGYRGNSFVAAVEFGDRVRALSLLAGGQSGDPASPHFFDQGQRYADRQFKRVPFYREEVERRALRRYRPGDITADGPDTPPANAARPAPAGTAASVPGGSATPR